MSIGPFVPLQSDFLDQNGNISRPWIDLFLSIGSAQDVKDILTMLAFTDLGGKKTAGTIFGTRAARLALSPQVNTGTFYFETDTGLLYGAFASIATITGATNTAPIVISATNFFVSGDNVTVGGVLGNTGANGIFPITAVSGSGFTLTGSTGTGAYTSGGVAKGPVRWVYIVGEYRILQTNLAAFAATLAGPDHNLIVLVKDYGHALKWTGSAFTWQDDDLGSGYFQAFAIAPTSTGWQICNGTSTNYLNPDGTLTAFTVPDLTSVAGKAAFAVLGSPYTGSSVAPVLPTLTKGTLAVASTTVNAGTGAAVTVGSTALTGIPVATTAGAPQSIVIVPYFRQ